MVLTRGQEAQLLKKKTAKGKRYEAPASNIIPRTGISEDDDEDFDEEEDETDYIEEEEIKVRKTKTVTGLYPNLNEERNELVQTTHRDKKIKPHSTVTHSRSRTSSQSTFTSSTPPKSSTLGSCFKYFLAPIFATLLVLVVADKYYSNELAKVIGFKPKDEFLNSVSKLYSTFIHFDESARQAKLENLTRLLTTSEFNQTVPSIGKRVLKVVFEKATDRNQKSPVVLLLIAPINQNGPVRTISYRLTNLMATGEYHSTMPASTIQIKPTHTKKDVENFYQQAFNDSNQPVLLLEDLEQLKPSEAMVFHQFMDGEQSKFPNSFVIITLKYAKPLDVTENVTPKQLSDISARVLTDLWKNAFNKDSLDCVINRIAEHSVVLIDKK